MDITPSHLHGSRQNKPPQPITLGQGAPCCSVQLVMGGTACQFSPILFLLDEAIKMPVPESALRPGPQQPAEGTLTKVLSVGRI